MTDSRTPFSRTEWEEMTLDADGNILRAGKTVTYLPASWYPDTGLFAEFKGAPGLLVVTPIRFPEFRNDADPVLKDMILVAYAGAAFFSSLFGLDLSYALIAPASYADKSGVTITAWHLMGVTSGGDVSYDTTSEGQSLADLQSKLLGGAFQPLWDGLPEWFRSRWAAKFGGPVGHWYVAQSPAGTPTAKDITSSIGDFLRQGLTLAKVGFDFLGWVPSIVLLGAASYGAYRMTLLLKRRKSPVGRKGFHG